MYNESLESQWINGFSRTFRWSSSYTRSLASSGETTLTKTPPVMWMVNDGKACDGKKYCDVDTSTKPNTFVFLGPDVVQDIFRAIKW